MNDIQSIVWAVREAENAATLVKLHVGRRANTVRRYAQEAITQANAGSVSDAINWATAAREEARYVVEVLRPQV